MTQIILIQNNVPFDISNLTGAKQWSGSKGTAPRTFNFEYLKSNIKIDTGDKVIFRLDGVEKFRGMIFEVGTNKNKIQSVTCFDSMFYLANNHDTFKYKNITSDEIFVDVCKRFRIPYLAPEKSTYRIPSLIEDNSNIYDVLIKALGLNYQNTGQRYYIRDENGFLRHLKRRDNALEWVIETGVNLIDYDYTESITEMATQIKLVSKSSDSANKTNTNMVIVQNKELIDKFGVLQLYEEVNEKLNKAQLQQKADTLLKEKSQVKKQISIQAIGIPDAITGNAIFLYIPELDIKKSYYIDADNHSFMHGKHEMSLTLTETLEI